MGIKRNQRNHNERNNKSRNKCPGFFICAAQARPARMGETLYRRMISIYNIGTNILYILELDNVKE